MSLPELSCESNCGSSHESNWKLTHESICELSPEPILVSWVMSRAETPIHESNCESVSWSWIKSQLNYSEIMTWALIQAKLWVKSWVKAWFKHVGRNKYHKVSRLNIMSRAVSQAEIQHVISRALSQAVSWSCLTYTSKKTWAGTNVWIVDILMPNQ